MKVWHLIKRIQGLIVGRRLTRSVEHHKEAADQLDAALRKVLKK